MVQLCEQAAKTGKTEKPTCWLGVRE
jgi:hypothetical protein